jgi:hypothetical protein
MLVAFRNGYSEQGAARPVRNDKLQATNPSWVRGELLEGVQDPAQCSIKVRQVRSLAILQQDILVGDVEEKARHARLLSRIGVRTIRQRSGLKLELGMVRALTHLSPLHPCCSLKAASEAGFASGLAG